MMTENKVRIYQRVKLGLIKDGKCGATAPRAARIKRALVWIKFQSAELN